MLRNPIYTGDFLWLGQRRRGSHEPLVSHETFDQRAGRAQAEALRPRAEAAARLHGPPDVRPVRLLHDGREEEGQVHLLPMHGLQGRMRQFVCPGGTPRRPARRDRSRPSRSRRRSPPGIAEPLRTGESEVEQHRTDAIRQLEQRRRTVTSKLDRGYDDFVAGHISERPLEAKIALSGRLICEPSRPSWHALEQPRQPILTTAQRILELAQKAEFLYKSQDRTEQRRLLEIVLSNCTFDRGSLSPTYNSPFDLLVRGNKSGNWRRGWDSNRCTVMKTKNYTDFDFLTIR